MKTKTAIQPWVIAALFLGLWFVRLDLVPAYFERTLRLGYYPPEADSIAIPIAGNVVATVILSPAWILFLWLSLRHYPNHVGLFAWNQQRWGWSLSWTLLSAIAVYMAADSLVESIRIGLPMNASADALWAIAWLVWRSVVVSRLKEKKGTPNQASEGTARKLAEPQG